MVFCDSCQRKDNCNEIQKWSSEIFACKKASDFFEAEYREKELIK